MNKIDDYLRNGVVFEDICREDPRAAATYLKELQARLDSETKLVEKWVEAYRTQGQELQEQNAATGDARGMARELERRAISAESRLDSIRNYLRDHQPDNDPLACDWNAAHEELSAMFVETEGGMVTGGDDNHFHKYEGQGPILRCACGAEVATAFEDVVETIRNVTIKDGKMYCNHCGRERHGTHICNVTVENSGQGFNTSAVEKQEIKS